MSNFFLDTFVSKLNDYKEPPYDYTMRATDRLRNKKKLLRRKAVYALYKNNKLVYIGASRDVRQRLSNHNISYDFADVYILESQSDPFDLEAKLINKHLPKWNAVIPPITHQT